MPFLGSQPAEVALTTGDLGDNIVDGTKTKDALIGDYSDVTITASDLIMYGDATDSNNTKRDTVQGILDLASGGKVLQRVTASTNAIVTGTTQITLDDSIPQNNEGVEVETCAITPTASASRLLIFANMTFAWSARGNVQVALFQDSTANAISAVTNLSEADGTTHTVTLIYEMEAGTTSGTTFKVRIGAESSGTLTLNGLGGSRKLGGAARSGIEILEISA